MAVIACNIRSTSARAASSVRLEASPPPPGVALSTCTTSPSTSPNFSLSTLSIPIFIVTVELAQDPHAPSRTRYTFFRPPGGPVVPATPPPFPVSDAADRDVPAIGYQVRPDLVEDRVDILGGQLGGSSRRTRGDAPSLGRVVLARRLVVAVVDSDGGPLEGQDDSGALAGRRRRRRRRRPPPAAPAAAMAAATPDEPVPLTKRGGDGDKTAARDSAIVRR